MVDASSDDNGRYNGVAPDVSLVAVKGFDGNGQGSYADVIRGLDWVVANRRTYDIRVLNLSFSAPPRSPRGTSWPITASGMHCWRKDAATNRGITSPKRRACSS